MLNNESKFCGFEPIYDSDSRILILGSFPSVKSREHAFYYGNKQNRFWKLLSEFYGCKADTIEDKISLCLSNRIALWDIVQSCQIVGSLDSAITNYTLVDLSHVLTRCNIEKILCNGQKSYQLTKSVYRGDIPVVKMPSTSPANVRFDKTVWFENLKTIG